MRDSLLQTVVYADGKEILCPYYHGWICNRVSKWKDDLDMHIILIQQVIRHICLLFYQFQVIGNGLEK